MSKFTDALRTIKVFNDYEFFQDQPWITRYMGESRGFAAARWCVYRRGRKLGTAWYEHDGRWFAYVGREAAVVALAEAQSWAGKEFGVKAWAKGPHGAWGPADFVKRRTAELKAKIERLSRRP